LVVALLRVLPQAIESARSRGESLNEPTPYAEAMKNLPNLSGEIVTDMGSVPVRGADFWRSGSEGVGSRGAAGSTDVSWHALLATSDALGRLAAFKRPRLVRYLEALPRNALGKVLKHELRG